MPMSALALPDASGISSSISGTLESRTVSVTLKFDSSDIGKDVAVYLALLSGKNVFFLNTSNQFVPFDGKTVNRVLTLKPTSSSMTMSIARDINVLAIPGVALVLGYGVDANEMLVAKRYRQVYPSEVIDGQVITLPTPRTPQAFADAEEMLVSLKARLEKYNPNDPQITQDTGFLRDAWLADQIGKQIAEQMKNEQAILEAAAQTGKLSLPPGGSVSIPSDGGGVQPPGCGKTLECKTSYDSNSAQNVLTVSSADIPVATSSTGSNSTPGATPLSPPTSTEISADEVPLQDAPKVSTPGSTSAQSCMPWATSCTNSSFSQQSFGGSMNGLAVSVESTMSSMLNQCYQYILNVYNSQCPDGGSCHGSQDRAVVTGSYNFTTKQYDLECHEAAAFWTYTKGKKLYQASIDASGAILYERTNYAKRLYKSFADTKKASLQKLIGNVVVGQVPYLSVANSLVKCVSGQTGVDWALNAFTEINTVGCIETAANLVKSLAAVPTLPLRVQEARLLYQNMSLAARGVADEAKYIGWGATGVTVAEEFYRRGKYAIKNADLHQ